MQLRVDCVKACSINGKLTQLWNSYGPGAGPQASGAIAELQGQLCLDACIHKITNSFVDISEARPRCGQQQRQTVMTSNRAWSWKATGRRKNVVTSLLTFNRIIKQGLLSAR